MADLTSSGLPRLVKPSKIKPQERVSAAPTLPARSLKADKLPPCSPEVEKAALCVILYNPAKSFPVLEQRGRDSFFFTSARQWLVQMRSFYREKGHLDQVVFLEYVLSNPQVFEPIGGHKFYIELQTQFHPFEVLDHYLAELAEQYTRRSLFAQATRLMKGGDVVELLSDIERTTADLKRVAGGPNGSVKMEYSELMAFDCKHDPNCLVGNRWLVKGGSSLWAAGSGYGKSTLALQLAVYWACGVPCFGLRPVRPLKSLIIQAENDVGDMGEQLQGVMKGVESLGDIDIQERRDLIEKNIGIHRAIGKTGNDFLALLDTLLEIERPDIAWPDPLFAFAGCDLMNAKEMGYFLRNGLFPLANKRQVAMNVIHHIGKPVRGDTKAGQNVAEIDEQYLGFGTSEIQNAFRAVNVLVPVSGQFGVYKLTLAKRGERAAARDVEGNVSRSIYLQHSTEGICWMQAEKPEKKKAPQATIKYVADDILGEMSVVTGWPTKALQEHMKVETGMSPKTFYRLWKDLKKEGQIRLDSDQNWIKNGA